MQVLGCFPPGLLKVGLYSSPTNTTGRWHLPPVGTTLLCRRAVQHKADSLHSSLGCQLFAVHTSPLGSVRIPDEAGNGKVMVALDQGKRTLQKSNAQGLFPVEWSHHDSLKAICVGPLVFHPGSLCLSFLVCSQLSDVTYIEVSKEGLKVRRDTSS